MVVPTGADATKNDFGTQVSSFASYTICKICVRVPKSAAGTSSLSRIEP